MIRIGLDLGGTKTEIAALDRDGTELLRRRVPTPAGAYEESVRTLAGLVTDAERELGRPARVGLGHPGAVDPATGLLRNAYATVFNARALQADLSRALAREVRFENDANCFALSEATDGAGSGARVVFGAILGTGAGSGIVIEGHLLRGAHGLAGEWGHNPLPWIRADELPGPRCYCGRDGCIERFVSGPALAADHERATGMRLDPAAIMAAANSGDAACRASLERHEDRVARALAHVVNLVDPDVVVLGGGLSHFAHLYENLPTRIAAIAYAKASPPILRARHGDASGVRGAAMLWPSTGEAKG
ncbi:MAG: ROK family protein [Betaproteobacteria bacterium]|nr:ROK family protein [Betaproteobacteria bacterium]